MLRETNRLQCTCCSNTGQTSATPRQIKVCFTVVMWCSEGEGHAGFLNNGTIVALLHLTNDKFANIYQLITKTDSVAQLQET
jgi:hypothetical protein